MAGRARPEYSRRTVTIMAVLNFLIPGVGHFYLGYLPRGFVWIAGIVAMTVVLSQGPVDRYVQVLMAVALGVFSAIDGWIVFRPDRASAP